MANYRSGGLKDEDRVIVSRMGYRGTPERVQMTYKEYKFIARQANNMKHRPKLREIL